MATLYYVWIKYNNNNCKIFYYGCSCYYIVIIIINFFCTILYDIGKNNRLPSISIKDGSVANITLQQPCYSGYLLPHTESILELINASWYYGTRTQVSYIERQALVYQLSVEVITVKNTYIKNSIPYVSAFYWNF